MVKRQLPLYGQSSIRVEIFSLAMNQYIISPEAIRDLDVSRAILPIATSMQVIGS